jgi:perosamine synthetase
VQVRLADVDPVTGNLAPDAVARLIGPRTRAITAVHLAGRPADMPGLAALARARGLALIEDGCHALGAAGVDGPVGSDAGAADATVFSFHPVKHITTGEGGAVTTRDRELKRTIDRLRNHGIERDPSRLRAPAEGPWSYEVQDAGWNYRLPDVLCALGRSQLTKLPRFVARRRALAERYRDALARAFGVGPDALVTAPAADAAPTRSAYHLFAVAIDFGRAGASRATVMHGLASRGIGSQVHYIPLDRHPLHAARCALDVGTPRPGADRYYARTLSLPLFPAMDDADVDRVVDSLAATLQESRS